jgi:pimeloyl-ACP methyl ester carboxylesterase
MVRPVVIWHGTDDTLVPIAHGRWLAEHVNGARAHLVDGEGHISIGVNHFERMVDELMEIARRA